MPNYNPELTADEKRLLLDEAIRYHEMFNNKLPDNMKIEFNINEFKKRLEDPEEVLRYRRSVARQESEEKSKEIYSKLESQFGKPPVGRHYLNRNIRFGFKTDGSKESEEYNEKMYKDYVANPEKALYNKLKNLINADPQQYVETLGNPKAMIDYYDNNKVLIEDGFVIDTMLKDKALDWVTPELNNTRECLKGPLEAFGFAKKEAMANQGSAYFTMPKINFEQAVILSGAGPEFMGKGADPAVTATIQKAIESAPDLESPQEYFEKLQIEGIHLNNKFYYSHVAEERKDDGTKVSVTFDKAIEKRQDPNFMIRERTDEEKWHLKNISKDFEREYLAIWQKKYAELSDTKTFNFEEIKEQNKGNIFERMFRRTSNEYKEFIKQFEDYNNPNSKDYLNREKLREKADAYEQHKLRQGKSYDQMDATSKGRIDLVTNVKNTLDYMDKADDVIRNQIENKLYADKDNQKSLGDQFLNIEDVEEKDNSMFVNTSKDDLFNDIKKILNNDLKEQEVENENINEDSENKMREPGEDDGIDGLDELNM